MKNLLIFEQLCN